MVGAGGGEEGSGYGGRCAQGIVRSIEEWKTFSNAGCQETQGLSMLKLFWYQVVSVSRMPAVSSSLAILDTTLIT